MHIEKRNEDRHLAADPERTVRTGALVTCFFFKMTTNHWPVINVNYYYSVILQSAHGAAPWGEELVPINQKVQTEQVCQVPLWGTIGLQACPKPIVVNSGQQQSPC